MYAALDGWGASVVRENERARKPQFHLCGNTLRTNASKRRCMTARLSASEPSRAGRPSRSPSLRAEIWAIATVDGFQAEATARAQFSQ
jgi:hypothetical protein